MQDLRNMKECFTYKNHNKDVTSIAVHPFTNLFVTGNNEGLINFWDIFNDSPIGQSDSKHENTIWSLDFYPAGHALGSGAADCTIKFWIRPRPKDFENREEVGGEDESMAQNESFEIPEL